MDLIEAFFELLREDYLVWSDGKALAAIFAAAGTEVAPDTTEWTAAGINAAHGSAIQGALALDPLVTPSFVIFNQAGLKTMAYTKKDEVPEYFTATFRTDGQGNFVGTNVVGGPDALFTAAGILGGVAAVVGGREAIEVDELGEVPLTIDALEIAKGGVDRAVHGYAQTFIPYSDGVILIGA